MFENFIKALAASLLLASPLLAADVNGVFSGQGTNGPVVLQLQPGPQGYLVGKLRSNKGLFAVVATQNGDRLNGMFGAPGMQPMQFAGSVQSNGTLMLTCNGSTIQLASNQPAAAQPQAQTPAPVSNPQNNQPTATTADPNDSFAAEMKLMANQASQERAAELAKISSYQNSQPAAPAQAYPNGYSAYGTYPQVPAQPNTGYYGGNYQTGANYQAGGNYQTGGNYPVQQPQAYPNAGAGYGYTAPYTPMPAQQPAVNYNQPNDGSAMMSQYEHQQAVDDQISLQRSDTMREQNRYVGPDGTEIIAPENATQVTVDQGGQATYTTEQAPTPPANETVAQPYSYSAPASPTEGDGN